MALERHDQQAISKLKELARQADIDIAGAKVRRSSSRFCFGVEHGDYNGTELFGVGTDRFIWLAYKPSGTGKMRLFSGNFPDDGVVEFEIGKVPKPKSAEVADTWARFPYGVDYVLRREGYRLTRGIDAVLYGNIPGGGMSRSASLTLNLILSVLDANSIKVDERLKVVDMAQAVENDYIGSPCGQLDQIVILFANAGAGVHYKPQSRSIEYVPFGAGGDDFGIVILDTGTVRPGLEKSTYKIRRAECEEFVRLIQKAGYEIKCLADVRTRELYDKIISQFKTQYPELCKRLDYIYHAQVRFYEMLDAWKQGDIETVGRLFNEDGIGLRDQYKISGPQLEAMCDIARQVPGVLGARMLGGGDKGAAGALVKSDGIEALIEAVKKEYPRRFPEYGKKFSVHACKLTAGVQTLGKIGQGRI